MIRAPKTSKSSAPLLIFSHHVFNFQAYGGISRYYSEVIKRLKADFRVRTYAGFHINRYLSRVHNVWGVRLPNSPSLFLFRAVFDRAFVSLLNLITAPDIVHLTYFGRVLKRKDTKLVVTVYDMINEIFPEMASSRPEHSERKRFSCEEADLVIAISNTTKADLVRIFGIPPEKVKVIYLAAGETFGGSSRKESVTPFFLYVGERGGYKNFDVFLDAYFSSGLSDKVEIVCFGGGAPTPEECSKLSKLRLMDRVRFVTGNDEVLLKLYESALALAYTSSYEGFGLPILEAFKASCPVICAATPAVEEIAADGALYFKAGDATDLRRILEKTFSDPVYRESRLERARNRASNFSWERCAAEHREAYRELLSGSPDFTQSECLEKV